MFIGVISKVDINFRKVRQHLLSDFSDMRRRAHSIRAFFVIAVAHLRVICYNAENDKLWEV